MVQELGIDSRRLGNNDEPQYEVHKAYRAVMTEVRIISRYIISHLLAAYGRLWRHTFQVRIHSDLYEQGEDHVGLMKRNQIE